jgi:AAA+ superfamily predicted ATPase
VDTKAVLIERMIRFTLPKYTIRVWMQESLDYEYSIIGLSNVEIVGHKNQDLSMRELVEKILEVEGVNAVECLDWTLNGIVAYANW